MERSSPWTSTGKPPWWKAVKGKAHETQIETILEVERRHSATFERFVRLEVLYDPNSPYAGGEARAKELLGAVTENVIASNVDTVHAVIAATDVRARFMTDGADWGVQRRARQMDSSSVGRFRRAGWA